MGEFQFMLGTHHPGWLGRLTTPLFVSHRRLRKYKTLPRAQGTWALDSGGFTELSMHGRWVTTLVEYVEAVARYRDGVGGMLWAAPQDWMCEPVMLAKTGLTVREHQELTVTNSLNLVSVAPGLPFIPVLQGWAIDDYLTCLDLYRQAGVDLIDGRLVGVGSVCRRQATTEIADLIGELSDAGVRMHGFGMKLAGLRHSGHLLDSADSMAWSFQARKSLPLPGHKHKNCANCIDYAVAWYERILAEPRSPSPYRQLRLAAA
jgi:hypothetical protein